MRRQPGITWLRFGACAAVGLVFYAAYGRTHPRLRRGTEVREL